MQKKPPVNPRSTLQKDTDGTREFKGGGPNKVSAGGIKPNTGAKPPQPKLSQKGPATRGKR